MGGKGNRSFDEWWAERSLPQKIGMGILFGIGGLGLAFLFGLVVMALWNWLMPEIFGLKQITYWQGWGLFILCTILFKGMNNSTNVEGKSDRKRKRELRRYMEEDGCGEPGEGDQPDGESGSPGPDAPDGADEGNAPGSSPGNGAAPGSFA